MRWTPFRVGGLVAAAIAASIYGWTLAPGVGAGDSGELILAARDLGIPHPPGYPIWVLLARIATVVPIGSVALRVNALSAFLSAVGAGLFYLLASRVGLPRAPRVLVPEPGSFAFSAASHACSRRLSLPDRRCCGTPPSRLRSTR